MKEEAKKRMESGRNQYSESPPPVPEEGSTGEAVQQAAKLVGVGATLVYEAKAVSEANPALFQQIECCLM